MPPYGSERGEGELRIRLRFSKLGKIRFTSQRDTARMWERALRRDGFPVAYSAGFSPRPQLSFGLALPTGSESLAEYLDVKVDEARAEAVGLDPAACPDRLTPLLPDGVEITAAAGLADGSESLQEAVTSCRWVLAVAGDDAELADRVAAALDADHLPVMRHRKGRRSEDDLRPQILSLEVGTGGGGTVDLVAELTTRPRGVRPAELMAALAAAARPEGASAPTVDDHEGPKVLRACRTNQWIECDGTRREPLSESGPGRESRRTSLASERAS